jgi:hypothetical protein
MALLPSNPAKVSKTPIRINPLVYSVCGKYRSRELEFLNIYEG